jgi:predicted  nucleic acid-binding Zn-ribbon protein
MRGGANRKISPMPIENEYVGREEVGSDSYLGKSEYKVTCRCLRCGGVYSKIVKRLTDDNPPCPKKKCREAIKAEERALMERNIREMIEAERGPAQIGNKIVVKAIDTTAEIVQQDYGLTNLKDNIRQGEAMAPRLPPKMQDAADNFFSPQKALGGGDARRRKQMDLIGKRAMAGAYRGMALNPAAVVPGTMGQNTLRKIGDEKLRDK